jgi:hypothetical protein
VYRVITRPGNVCFGGLDLIHTTTDPVPERVGDAKGVISVGQGFTVKPSALQSGSEGATGLQEYCLAVAQDAVETLGAMAGSAGHADLASALTDAAGRGDKAFTGMVAAYGHCSQSLAASAQTYTSAENANTAAAKGIGDQDIPFLNGIG